MADPAATTQGGAGKKTTSGKTTPSLQSEHDDKNKNTDPPKDPSKPVDKTPHSSTPKDPPPGSPKVKSACVNCDKPDNCRMVQCDSCDEWTHYTCVGVSDDVADISWSCLKCVTAEADQKRKAKSKKTTSMRKTTNTKSRKKTSRATEVKEVKDGGKKTTVKAAKKSTAKGQVSKAGAKEVNEKSAKSAKKLEDKVKKADSILSVSSFKSAKARLEVHLKQIEAEETLMEEEMKRKRELVKKKFDVLKELADLEVDGASVEDVPNSHDKVEDWLKDNRNRTSKKRDTEPSVEGKNPEPSVKTGDPSEKDPTIEDSESSDPSEKDTSVEDSESSEESSESEREEEESSSEEEQYLGKFVPGKQSTLKNTAKKKSRADLQCSSGRQKRLSKDALAARQVVPRELPKFSGNPEEWPMFLSTYEDTTEMCGYTEAENMIRLRSCLKGDAFNAVRSFLMRPATVGKAIKALKLRFGRPETIIEYLKDKIVSLPAIKADAMDKLVDFALEVQNLSATIDTCGAKEYKSDVTLLKELVKKLPPNIRLDWARYQKSKSKVKLSTFSRWIYGVAEDVNSVFEPQFRGGKQQESRSVRKEKYVNTHSEVVAREKPQQVSQRSEPKAGPSTSAAGGESKSCWVCKGNCRNIGNCKRFQELSYEAKWATIREFHLCRKCLRRHKGGCDAGACGKNGCTYKHHALLHKDFTVPVVAGVSGNNTEHPAQNEERNIHTHLSDTVPGSFRYLPVTLYGNNKQVECYAFLDDGSELTLVDEELVEALQISGDLRPLCLKWTGGTHRFESNSHSVNVEISGREGKRYRLQDVRTVKELQLPCQSLDVNHLKNEYSYLRNLPIDSYSGVRPRILIGLKHANIMLVRKSREGKMGEPIAVKTNLGWAVYGVRGRATEDLTNTSHTYHICSCSDSDETKLHQIVKNYFSLDSLGVVKEERTLLSRDDERAVALLESRTRYNGERYETGLLWRSDSVRLPDSKALAERRFKCLEKRMDKDNELARVLHEKMADYRSKGYIRKLSPEDLAESHQRVWYLPIFPVTNPNKPGKVRVVWDAAAAAHGVSLNSALLTGPDQLASLVGILYQFREHRIGLCADIREMFHQVQILPEDQHCQRFLWRDDPEQREPSTYVMQVMTFGACCSPSAAQFVKNRNAERFQDVYPEAVAVIQKKHYVDDMVLSTKTEKEAIQLAETVRFIHEQGGFEIRNWVSNSSEVLAKINGEAVTEKDLDLTAELASQKILGMWWDTKADTFKYKISWSRFDRTLLEGSRCPTKREVLRTLMTIYDPLGLIEHFMILLKILLQEVWRCEVDWDEPIPQAQFENWQVWLNLLPELEQLQIPRCYQRYTTADEETVVELHTFVDSSETAMAAAVYLRFIRNGDVECALVGAKTRVAPIKYMSIPRLELQAAVMGCRLASSIAKNLNFKVSKRVFWTDSRNVLCWLRSDHRRYSAFVASRVGEILESTDVQDWRWVPTGSNVADDGTRWRNQPDLSAESRWFTGPEFLRKNEGEWPVLPLKSTSTEEELRPRVMVHCQAPESVIDVGRFSSWRTMVEATAWMLRFSSNLRRRISGESGLSGPVTSEELRRAEEYHFKQAQRDVYQSEIAVLATRDGDSAFKHVPKSSSLHKLSPFVDEFGVLRMRGRTGVCAYLHADAKNPVILPPDHPVTTLLLRYYHEKYLHRNHEIVVNEVRQKYNIFRLRPALAKVRRNCQRCKNRDALPQPPEMADLPEARLAAFTRPFSHVGVDYFGPMEVAVGKKVQKRWGVLLTCLTTRGVYIEVVSTLTTSSCIMAIKSFIVRKGTPISFYSDRGTNFVGANRVLREALREVDRNQMMREFVTPSTSWHFNPPASPHMGGSWERLIQSVKRNLTEVLAVQHPTDEELRNALTEIEGVVNSRPLTHVPIDDESAPALTPNHFILGSSDGSKPLTLIDTDKANLRRGWPTSQWLANLFWKRWIKDYLPEITRRTRWYEKVRPLEVGDIVVIVDADHPRNCWPKGRVIGVVSSGGQTRRATVQTSNGIYERPVVKLAVLDVRRGAE